MNCSQVERLDCNSSKTMNKLLQRVGLGCFLLVRHALNHGADINMSDNDGFTPLHHAVWCDHIENVQLLLDAGSTVNTTSKESALYLAAIYGHLNVVQILLDHGAQFNIKDVFGKTVLCT